VTGTGIVMFCLTIGITCGWAWLAEAALYNPDRTLKRVTGWVAVIALTAAGAVATYVTVTT
jgi:hypothetical protein